MLGRVTKAIGGLFRRGGAPAEEKSFYLRRWEAAETNRLNRAQWQKAIGRSINEDLAEDLDILRKRTTQEVSRNPTLEGVISTYCTDVVGRDGPKLQVICEDEADQAWADALEDVWCDWFAEPDVRGIQGGADMLRLGVRQLWTSGEFLLQKVSRRAVRRGQDLGPVALRLKIIEPCRLATPAEYAGDADVVLGVRQTPDGQPLEYYVEDPLRFGAYYVQAGKFTPVRADLMVHRFILLEADQARGVPWLATPLQAVADSRDYDAQVLDAARQAADWAVYLSTDHPDANYLELNESTNIERRTISTCPPGWKPQAFAPPQPQTTYVDYRSERQRDIGRPVGMPLMMVRLDSSKHNYSSARFDSQIYVRGIQALQGWLGRRTLNGVVADVRREAELYAAAHPEWKHAAALRRPPKGRVRLTYVWPPFPHVDVAKEATGEQIRLENGTLAFSDACAANGTDEDTEIAKRARTIAKFKKANVPLPPALDPAAAAPKPGRQLAQDLEDEEKAEQQQDEEDAAGADEEQDDE